MFYESIDNREINQPTELIPDETVRLVNQLTSLEYPDSLKNIVYEEFSKKYDLLFPL